MSDGRKNDSTKDRWDLMPWKSAKWVVRVLSFGARKYDEHNWKRVDDGKRRYWTAAIRHLVAWSWGERLDRESGLPHLAHAACCVLFVMELEREEHEAGQRKDADTNPAEIDGGCRGCRVSRAGAGLANRCGLCGSTTRSGPQGCAG